MANKTKLLKQTKIEIKNINILQKPIQNINKYHYNILII